MDGTGREPITDNTVSCSCGRRWKSLESRVRVYGTLKTMYRRKGCDWCGTKISTAEVPLKLARELFEDE